VSARRPLRQTARQREAWLELARLALNLRRREQRARLRDDPAALEEYRRRNALEAARYRARLSVPCGACLAPRPPWALEEFLGATVCRDRGGCVRRRSAAVLVPRERGADAPAVDASTDPAAAGCSIARTSQTTTAHP